MIERLPALNALDARVVMQDQYDVRYGLLSPELAHHPLASVLMQPCEDMTRNSALYDLYEEYAVKNYRELWGIGVDEYLNRPVWVVEMMREIADHVLEKRSAAVERIASSKASKD